MNKVILVAALSILSCNAISIDKKVIDENIENESKLIALENNIKEMIDSKLHIGIPFSRVKKYLWNM